LILIICEIRRYETFPEVIISDGNYFLLRSKHSQLSAGHESRAQRLGCWMAASSRQPYLLTAGRRRYEGKKKRRKEKRRRTLRRKTGTQQLIPILYSDGYKKKQK
jgi:hypothetical protein